MNIHAPNLNIGRRELLKGLASVGVLSATQIEQAFAQTTVPLRVMLVSLNHGWGIGREGLDQITGTSETDFQLPAFWEPFEKIKNDCIFVDGLMGTFWGNSHDVSYSDVFTAGVPIHQDTDRELLGGPFPAPLNASLDYLLEQHHGMEALRLSVQYGSFGAKVNPLCFNDRIQPMPFYTTASSAYKALFSNRSTSQSPVIDQLFPYISQGTQEFINKLGQSEKDKLLSYLDASTRLKDKLNTSNDGGMTFSHTPESKQSFGDDFDDFLEMIKVSFVNDSHRVAVLGLGDWNDEFEWVDEAGETHFGHSSLTGDFHHDIAHNRGKSNDAKLAFQAWIKYYADRISNFALNLKNTTDIDGSSMLDNTLIMLTGEVGEGNHDNSHKAHIVIGGGNRVNSGRWLHIPRGFGSDVSSRNKDGVVMTASDTDAFFDRTPCATRTHADLLLKIGQLAGLNINSFGIDVRNKGPLEI